MTEPDPACGTPKGSLRHRRHGEKPCDDCRKAHAEYMSAWRDTEAGRRSTKIRAAAHSHAHTELAALHRDEYRRLYRQWYRKLAGDDTP